jgi:hypothetical protein
MGRLGGLELQWKSDGLLRSSSIPTRCVLVHYLHTQTSGRLLFYSFPLSASTLYLLCSQVAITAPSFSRFIVPLSRDSRLPACTI